MTDRARRLWSGSLLALALAALIVLLVVNWSRSLLAGIAAVGAALVIALVVAIFAWHGDVP